MEILMLNRSVSNPKPLTTNSKNQNNSLSRKPPPKKSSLSFSNKAKVAVDSHLNRLCKDGRLNDAVLALHSLSQNGSKIEPDTFVNLIQCCIDSNSVAVGRKIHAHVDLVSERSPLLATALVGMYAKCGRLGEARKVFEEMRERDVYTWSAMIGACAREQRWKEVVELFNMMMEDNVLADVFLLPKILQACGNSGNFEAGRLIHGLVVKCGLSSFLRVSNSILAVYAKCGRLVWARKFFERMDMRDRVSWNAMISGYCQDGNLEEARRLFEAMSKEGVEPGLITWNILISGYNQIGCCDVAMELMKEMESCGLSPDVVAWTTMISGFAQNNRTLRALDLFKEMILSGVEPNGVTIASAISACASLKALNKGLELHSLALKMGMVDCILVGNSLIDVYSKCGDLEAARKVFDMMSDKDVYTWNSMIGGYCQAGYCGKAYVLFMKMQNSDIRPNVITWNTIISGYIQNGDEDQAMDLFQRMEMDGNVKRDTASWNSIIAGFTQLGLRDKALGIFRQMPSFHVRPNPVTLLSVLPACASLVAQKKVKEIHGWALRRNLESLLPIANSLIDSYAKSGKIGYSRKIFDRMLSKDLITWNSLLTGYILHGCSFAALDLIDQMRKLGLKPNKGTLVNYILAHGLAGMVDEGKGVFSSMLEDYQIMPAFEHYSAMIVLYGRSGRLKEAMEFIEDMPIKPNSSVWFAFLTSCRIHGNSGLAMHAVESLLNLDLGNSTIQHSILQAYASCKNLEDMPKTKKLEMDRKARKLIGQSWIEVKNRVHSFVSGDLSKSYPEPLLSWVKNTVKEVEAHNANGFCIEELEEEEKEEIVGFHSEKLALGFTLFCVPSVPQSIRIVKNVRMCGDCHRMAKYVSTKNGCEIYLSDSTTMHHFKSGCCSCGDYW